MSHNYDCPAAYLPYGNRCTCGLTGEYRWTETFPPVIPAPVWDGHYQPRVANVRFQEPQIAFNPHAFVLEWAPLDGPSHPLIAALRDIPEESD